MTAVDRVETFREEIQNLWEDYRSQCKTMTSFEVCQMNAPTFSTPRKFNFIEWPDDCDEDDYEP